MARIFFSHDEWGGAAGEQGIGHNGQLPPPPCHLAGAPMKSNMFSDATADAFTARDVIASQHRIKRFRRPSTNCVLFHRPTGAAEIYARSCSSTGRLKMRE